MDREDFSYDQGQWHVDKISCPYCGYEDEDSWESYDDGEDLQEEKCKSCEAKFLKSVHTEITFDIYKDCIVNGEEHELKLEREGNVRDGTPFKYYECTKCNANYHDFGL